MSEIIRRSIKSFILRQGRLTQGQQRALDEQWPVFGIDFSPQPLDFSTVFGNTQPVILEIGFGNGESLIQMATENPQQNFVGIEVHRPGVGHILHLIHQQGIQNLRIMNHDAIDILQYQIPARSLSRVQLYFPDPWHKKKHNKRRIVQADFLDTLAKLLQQDGQIHFATDWDHYAQQMLKTLEAHPQFINKAAENTFSPKPDYRPTTKFERRGQRLGHGVWDLIFSVQQP